MVGYRGVVLGGGLLFAAAFGGASESFAAACGVEQAAQAALQRRLAVIDAAKVNPSEFFTGANSCISPDLLKSFDLSAMIPDLAGFLSGGIQGIAQQAINQAKQKACDILNEQVNGVIGKINDTTSSFNSGLTGDLAGILGSSFSISAPSGANYGSYDLSSLGDGFDFNGLQGAVNNVGSSINTTVSEGASSVVTTMDNAAQSAGSAASAVEAEIPNVTVTPNNGTSGGASWLKD
ncbi:hypothetical protein RMS29_027685 (plasmid) [Agrobacterium rosae]|uniref:Uncharacterized protein n=1 Tax=Agrobacterium rosae TaxID=1972867 RepID=A0AAW9FPX1_9HYPH|nr:MULTISPECIES: hypothetical protein [Agrobacterium]MCF1501547.1 hypothetical protein [Allorhizobium sp. Av2]MDX8321735.1 hypothetical protein [Agrobacterium sp. rho-8.1]MDX8305201.1 hypothetical protein [Agrobacterium rosae]MDX8311482.1 hypothetical protein [Agrobacterium sp. rho-13.3]MDX8316284.1 hypothetical protein [Agrobacterium rosae]